MDSAKVVQLIETDIMRRGDGTEGNPNRIVRQWFDFDGKLVVEWDDWLEKRLRGEAYHAATCDPWVEPCQRCGKAPVRTFRGQPDKPEAE